MDRGRAGDTDASETKTSESSLTPEDKSMQTLADGLSKSMVRAHFGRGRLNVPPCICSVVGLLGEGLKLLLQQDAGGTCASNIVPKHVTIWLCV